jgi:hypothetical protein
MQFTVLIEFLVPGLATTLLVLFLLPNGAVPQLPQGLPAGETASALLLLAVSYPVGILTNFPMFQLIQRRIVSVRARQDIVVTYAAMGIDLVALVNTQFGVTLPKPPVNDQETRVGRLHLWLRRFVTLLKPPVGECERLRMLFGLMRAFVFSKNYERLNANHLYHEGLQRFARGMLLPLPLACVVVGSYRTPKWGLLISLCALLAFSAWRLLLHSVKTEDDQIVRFFVILTSTAQSTTTLSKSPLP